MSEVCVSRESRGIAWFGGVVLALVLLWVALAAPAARAVPTPEQDPFYDYTGSTPLANIAPGTVLKTRTLRYHVAGIPLPVKAVQLLYRSTGSNAQPTVNVTSVLLPPISFGTPKIVAYQLLLRLAEPRRRAVLRDLRWADPRWRDPQRRVAPDRPRAERRQRGRRRRHRGRERRTSPPVPSTGCNTLDCAAGGDRLLRHRASADSPKIGLIGYSGGAIATEWAAELAPTYAPDVNQKLVGAAIGGVLVDPAHNLHYVDGSLSWAGVMPMAIIGVSRAFHIDLTPYLSEYGLQVYDKLEEGLDRRSARPVPRASPGRSWRSPSTRRRRAIPVYVARREPADHGDGRHPDHPAADRPGRLGELEGTLGNKPGIGEGDGVMIAGDVRTLARQYCERGIKVQYDQYDLLAHIETAVPWLSSAMPWLAARFGGLPAPQNCSQIPPGNPLTPIGP